MGKLSIEIIDPHWILERLDDPHDLCSHGTVVVRYGEEVLAQDEVTTSAAGLQLLRSLTQDHIPSQQCTQMLPCCGHTMWPQDDSDDVMLLGCPSGIDFEVRHEDNSVIMTFEDGRCLCVDYSEYKEMVLRFADEVERFYDSCFPKILPEDEFDARGYEIFWNEWHRRKRDALGAL